jgi:hypothetical protein
LRTNFAALRPDSQKERVNAKRKETSPSPMNQRRPAHVENDGQRKTQRYENREGFEANRWCHAGDGS